MVEEFPEFTPDDAFRALKGAISILEDLERRYVEAAADEADLQHRQVLEGFAPDGPAH